jgi:hypothetical protein
MELDIEEVNILTNIETKKIMSKKQLDKWIVFDCEFCGNKKEELICHYNKSKHHFCSYECMRNFRKRNSPIPTENNQIEPERLSEIIPFKI